MCYCDPSNNTINCGSDACEEIAEAYFIDHVDLDKINIKKKKQTIETSSPADTLDICERLILTIISEICTQPQSDIFAFYWRCKSFDRTYAVACRAHIRNVSLSEAEFSVYDDTEREQ